MKGVWQQGSLLWEMDDEAEEGPSRSPATRREILSAAPRQMFFENRL